MALFVGSVLMALGVSSLCSLMEAVLLSLTPVQVADLSARHARLGAIWRGFKENIERPIAVILILNTAAHTIGASVAGAQFDQLFGDEWIWLFSLLFTFAMLQYTEILPKTLGVHFNRELSVWIATPLALAISVLTPVIHVLHWLNKPFEGRRRDAGRSATLKEIDSLAAMARLSRQIGTHQERIIQGATGLSEKRVRDVMIPMEHVAVLSTKQSIAEAVIAAHFDAHTRFPVCQDGDRNRVVGYVNFKEMIYYMRTNPHDPSFGGIIRPVHFADPEQSTSELLKAFVDQHEHMAIVRNHDGQCLGLVTLEDLVEKLVGKLEDEFDRLPRHVHPLSGGTWLVGGGVSMKDLSARLEGRLAEASGSLAVWLRSELDGMPKPGQVARRGGVEFVIRRVRRGQIFEASVSLAP